MRALLVFGLAALLGLVVAGSTAGQEKTNPAKQIRGKTPSSPTIGSKPPRGMMAPPRVQTIKCPDLPNTGWSLKLDRDRSWVGDVPEGWTFALERGGWGRVTYRPGRHSIETSWTSEGNRKFLVCGYGIPSDSRTTLSNPVFSLHRSDIKRSECSTTSHYGFSCTLECPEISEYGWSLKMDRDLSWVGSVPAGWEFKGIEREGWGRVVYRPSQHSVSQTGNRAKFVCSYSFPMHGTVTMPLFSIRRLAPNGMTCEVSSRNKFICRR